MVTVLVAGHRLSLASLAGLTLLVAPRIVVAKETWIEGRSQNFHVISNMKEKDVRPLVEDFERFRAVVRFAMEDADAAEPTTPLTIYAVRKAKDLKELIPDSFDGKSLRIAGLFRRTPFEVQIFVETEQKDYASTIARHEYHHLYFDRSAPLAPLWLREGIANMWARARVDGVKLSLAFVTPGDLAEMQQDKSHILTIRELMEVRYTSAAYRENSKGMGFYASATMLTHFLLLRDNHGLAHMKQFNALLNKGTPQDLAMTTVWGDLDVLQEQFSRYCYGRAFASLSLILPVVVSSYGFESHELSPADVLAFRASLLFVGKWKPDAKRLLASALALEPDNTRALEVAGTVALSEDKATEAHALFDRACASLNATFAAHYLAAGTAERDEHHVYKDRAAVLKDLDECLSLAPRFTPAMLQKAELLSSDKTGEAERLGDAALALEPENPRIEILYAKIWARAGKRDEARKHAESATARALLLPYEDPSNDVCWKGTLAGLAMIVLPACEHAVQLAPDNWQVIDSRGLARAATTDTAGAISDFRFVVEHATRPDATATRKAWLDALLAGRNPVDASLLESLDTPGF